MILNSEVLVCPGDVRNRGLGGEPICSRSRSKQGHSPLHTSGLGGLWECSSLQMVQ